VLPLLPPSLILPPPPLLPPPFAAVPDVRRPEVPVIPEAEGVLLLGAGLATLGGWAGWRARRGRSP
jgi:hypothetical protein